MVGLLVAGPVRRNTLKLLSTLMLALVFPAALAADSVVLRQNLDGLHDSDWQVREQSAKALGALDPPDRAAIDALTGALDDADSRVRRTAADSLGQIGPKASKSIAALVNLFDDIDTNVILSAATAVGRMGSRASRSLPELTALLDHADSRVRIAAAGAIGTIGARANKSADELGAMLGDADPDVRATAARSLGQMGSGASEYSSLLVQMLGDEEQQVRDAASRALAEIGKAAVPVLIRSLGKGDPVFLQTAVDTLGRFGALAVPDLIKSLHNDDGQLLVRRYSALALAQIGSGNKKVLPALIESLDDEQADVRIAAIEALGRIGLPATSAAPQLIAIAGNQREAEFVRENAIAALARIAPQDARVHAALVAAVADGNNRIYAAAVAALVAIRSGDQMSDGSAANVSELDRQLRSDVASDKLAAARLLGETGPFAAAAVPSLIDVLADAGNGVELRAAAAKSLGLIGPDAEAAVPELIRTLDDDSQRLRDISLVALDRIGPQTKTIPALLQAMQTGDLATQAAAAQKIRSFARARKESWQPMLLQSDAPILRNWLARHADLYGVAVDETEIGGRHRDVEPADYFDVLGGRAAVRESMQLELIANPVTGTAGDRTVPVSALARVEVRSHPFDRMLDERNEPLRRIALAEITPQNRFFAWFRNIDAIRDAFATGSAQFLRFESALGVKSVDYAVKDRYLARLGLTDAALDGVAQLGAIKDLALIAPDLFFVDGTDITIVANLASAEISSAVLSILGLAGAGDAAHASHTLANGDTVYWTIRGAVLALSTNVAELHKVLELQTKDGAGSLGRSDEFLYMQLQISIEDESQAYFYFSDPFIRRLVSPEVKIAQLRRMQARAEMEMLLSGAMLYLLDGNRHIPSKEQLIRFGYVPPYFDERDYTISEDLIVSSGKFGTIAGLKPLSANPVVDVTRREEAAYTAFVTEYSNYWRQFFDPVATRLDRIQNDEMELTTFILPLVDSGLYDQVRSALATNETGRPLKVPMMSPKPSLVLSLNLSDDMRIELSQALAGMLVQHTSVNPDIFDSIGSAIHLAVQDSTPIVALGSGDVWSALDKDMLRMDGFDSFLPLLLSLVTQPSTILIELAEPQRVRDFLAEAVVRRSQVGGDGELHRLQGKEAWIYSLNAMDMFQLHLRVELKEGYLLISNLPWSRQVQIDGVRQADFNGAEAQLNLDEIDAQLPALHTKVYTDYRKAAVDGMGYLYPLLVTGVSGTVAEALRKHFEIFGFTPVHPASGTWYWRDSYLESSEFGAASDPVQPEFETGDRDFGIFPTISMLSVNMQLEDTGLRASIRWRKAAP